MIFYILQWNADIKKMILIKIKINYLFLKNYFNVTCYMLKNNKLRWK